MLSQCGFLMVTTDHSQFIGDDTAYFANAFLDNSRDGDSRYYRKHQTAFTYSEVPRNYRLVSTLVHSHIRSHIRSHMYVIRPPFLNLNNPIQICFYSNSDKAKRLFQVFF